MPPSIWIAWAVTFFAVSLAYSLDIEPSAEVKGLPEIAIQEARQTSRRAASIWVRMSANWKATPWLSMIGRPNCSRVCAYSRATS